MILYLNNFNKTYYSNMRKIYLLFLFFSLKILAQTPSLDNTFNTRDDGKYDQYIGYNSAMFSDGRLLSVYGFQDATSWKIIRINQDGSIDKTFNFSGNCGRSTKIFIKSNGKFLTLDEGLVKRYNNDGTLDKTFTLPVTVGVIKNLLIEDNGKTTIVGNFSKINNTNAFGIARLNDDGSIDNTFLLTYDFYASGSKYYINTIAIQKDGKYIVGGEFPSINNYNGRIRRLNNDGTNDDSFNVYSTFVDNLGLDYPLEGFDKEINKIQVQNDGKIMVSGGSFRSNGNKKSLEIVRLNSNGTRDTSFSLNLINSPTFNNSDISSFLILDNGKYLINTTKYKTYKLNSDGSIDNSYVDTNLAPSVYSFYDGTMFIQNGKFIINGTYNGTNGITRYGIYRLNSNGDLDLSFNPHSGTNLVDLNEAFTNNNNSSFTNSLHNPLVLSDGKIIIAGGFSSYNDNGCRRICRLTQDGEFDSSFTLDPQITLFTEQTDYQLNAILKEQNDGKILISNALQEKSAISINVNGNLKNLVRIDKDGKLDNSFNFTKSFNYDNSSNVILDYKIQKDGKIILLGSGAFFMDNKFYKLIRLNTDGSVDESFVSKLFNGIPSSLEIQPDGKILVCANLDMYSQEYNYLHRLNQDGSLDDSFKSGSQSNYSKLLENGKILVISHKSFDDTYIRRLTENGTIDKTFNEIITTKTFSQIFTSGNNIIVTMPLGQLRNSPTTENNLFYVFDQNGIYKNSFSGQQNYNHAQIVQQNCDNFIVAGNFFSIDGTKKNNIIRYSLSSNLATPPPVGESNQIFKSGQTLANLTVSGQNIQWYNSQSLCSSNNNATNKRNTNVVLSLDTILTEGTTYFATQTINGIESNYRLPVTVSQTLSTNDYVFENLKIYPNPIKNYFSISNSSSIDYLEIYDLLGQTLLSEKYYSTTIKIDLSNFSTGVYIAKIYSDNQIKSIKIIKQ